MFKSIDPRDVLPYVEDFVYNTGNSIMSKIKHNVGSRLSREAYFYSEPDIKKAVIRGIEDTFYKLDDDYVYAEYLDNEFIDIYENALEYYGVSELQKLCKTEEQKEFVEYTFGIPFYEITKYYPEMSKNYVNDIAYSISEIIVERECTFDGEMINKCTNYFVELMLNETMNECNFFLKKYKR